MRSTVFIRPADEVMNKLDWQCKKQKSALVRIDRCYFSPQICSECGAQRVVR